MVQKACFLLDEFQKTNFKLKPVVDRDETQWTPPKPPWFKLNFNGATFSASQSSGVGIVIRNSGGRVEAALSKSIP